MLDLTNYMLVFVRVSALLAVFPLFSATNVPVQLRIGLGVLTSFLVAPLLPYVPVTGMSIWALVHMMFVEVSVGLLLGFVCRMVFFALEFAGAFAGTEMGLSMSSNYNVLAGAQSSIPGSLLYWLALMLFLSLNLHHWMLAAFAKSYELVPIGKAHLNHELLTDVIGRTAMTFRIGVLIVAPIMGVSFVITLVYSTLSRAVPQMNVFSDSYAVRILAGLFVFGVTCHLMAENIENYLRRLPEDMLRVAQLLGHG